MGYRLHAPPFSLANMLSIPEPAKKAHVEYCRLVHYNIHNSCSKRTNTSELIFNRTTGLFICFGFPYQCSGRKKLGNGNLVSVEKLLVYDCFPSDVLQSLSRIHF